MTPALREAASSPGEILLHSSTAAAAWLDLGGLAVLLLSFETLAAHAVTLIADQVFGSADVLGDWADAERKRILLFPFLVVRAAGSIGIVALIVWQRRQSQASLGLRRDELGANLLIGVLSTAVLFGLVIISMNMLWLLWPSVGKLLLENAQRIQTMMPKISPLGLCGLAAIVGVYEELVFRGFIMTRLRRATGSWTLAVLITTVLFTLLHWPDQTAPALLSVALLSVVLSVVTIWRRSLVPAIVGHTLFNFFQLLHLYVTAGDSWT